MADPFPEWSRRLRNSDAAACTELFRATHRALLRYAGQLVEREGDAYDVVQEAFIKMWRNRAQIDPSRSLKAYLYQIVRNTALNHLRDESRRRNAHSEAVKPGGDYRSEGASVPSPQQALHARELRERLQAWIDELPPRRREAFRLSRFEGFTHAEIAEIMNLTPRTVTNHIMRALRDLRDRLHAYEARDASSMNPEQRT